VTGFRACLQEPEKGDKRFQGLTHKAREKKSDLGEEDHQNDGDDQGHEEGQDTPEDKFQWDILGHWHRPFLPYCMTSQNVAIMNENSVSWVYSYERTADPHCGSL
jgi:hypothetical protein